MNSLPRPLLYLILTLLIQVSGFALVSVIAPLFSNWPGPIITISLQSTFALILANWLSLPKSWGWINVLMPGAFFATLTQDLPQELILTVLVLMLLINLPTFWTKVPYYPTSRPMYEQISKILTDSKSQNFIDLGCGFGSLVIYLAKKHPNAKFTGVEIGFLTFLISWLRSKLSGLQNISIQYKNFWRFNLATYDLVYAFLAPDPMPALWQKVKRELKTGALFLTNTFEVDATPNFTIKVADQHGCRLMGHKL